VEELARQLADDLVRLTWELALNRARKPEDQAPPNRVKGAASWLEHPWGEQLSESLLAAILDHAFVEDIHDELSTTTDTVRVLKDLASRKVELPEKKARTHGSEA
jgi:hypothetical protein